MIDIHSERVLSLLEASRAECLPRRRRGQRPHVATLYRWATRGVRGVQLETIRVGGTLCTSLEALQRFCERCSDPSASVSMRTTTARERDIARAERELDRAGIA